jgi:hypothetical protein
MNKCVYLNMKSFRLILFELSQEIEKCMIAMNVSLNR